MRKICLLLFLLCIITSRAFGGPHDSLNFGLFGKVIVYRPVDTPESVVLFVSGDGGWNSGVVNMARNIVSHGALVAGIDIQHYYKSLRKLKTSCHYPAGDLEELSIHIQKKFHIAQYLKPILIGYSSGATLVYGALAEAPANTFKGAISLGFCPDIEIDRPLCNGSGLAQHVLKEGASYYLEPSEKLQAPFIVLQGMNDQVCPYQATAEYMKGLNSGELVSLPKVGHGFSVTRNWLPQFDNAFIKVQNSSSFFETKPLQSVLLPISGKASIKQGMPVILLPSNSNMEMPLAFLISGDGGWTSFDQSFAEALVKKGIPVIGLDAQSYFWNAKSPEVTASDIASVLEQYSQQWNRRSILLCGYSFGACIVPFIATRLPVNLHEKLRSIVLLSPSAMGDFEIHVSDMLSLGSKKDNFDVLAELRKINTCRRLCVFGEEEESELRKQFENTGSTTITVAGDHHYNNNYQLLTDEIMRNLF